MKRMLVTCRGRGGQAILIAPSYRKHLFRGKRQAIMREGYSLLLLLSIGPSGARLVGSLSFVH